ncbi:hypothetical protein JW707_03445 [Candidatus Woesearchaeota archaeon]|nr:hypothetical protein [Candidatus Woesearchaeota archaeon]
MQKTEIKQETGDSVIDIALDTIGREKQALVFVNTKRSAEKQAEEISKKLKSTKELEEISEKILNVLARPTQQCERLARCVKKGVAFHHAGLTQKQREIIENSFREGTVKIICCTPTLAAGVDLPAFRALIKDLKRYGGKFGMSYIPVLEYLQMAGRAGRPRFDKYGEAIIIAKTEPEKNEIHERYILGEPEDIFSKLAVEPVLRSSLLSLIATEFVGSREEIMGFFGRTFWAYQFRDMAELEEKINRMLRLLEDWEFIKSSSGGNDFVSADKMDEDSFKATMLGKRVSQLYIDPLTARKIILALQKAASLKVLKTFSFLQVISATLEMRPRLSVRVKEFELIQEKSAEYEAYLLENEPSVYEPEYEDYLESIKTALMFNDWAEEKTEEDLLEEYNIRPGEIRVKLGIGDWLLYCSEEIARILNFKDLIKEIRKARFRLKYGVKEELLPLLKLENVGRVRARALFRNRIKTIGDVRKAQLAELSKILGPKVAVKVKEQLGEKVNREEIEIPKGRRKGQLSLEKF